MGITPLIGRARELARIRQLLHAHERCVITVKGPGGIGKTLLVGHLVDALRRQETRYRDGIVMAELTGIDADGLVGAVARAFELPDNSASSPTEVHLVQHLQGKSRLLVLDNAEHLVGSADEPGPLPALLLYLLKYTSLQVLVTSQFRLGLPAAVEKLVEVPPLSCTSGQPDELSEAMQLAIDRAAALGKPVDPSQYPIVSTLVTRLEGHPHSIELAAGARDAKTWQEILEKLDDLTTLRAEGGAEKPTHRSVVDAAQWTYNLLEEHLQRSWVILSVFPDRFDAAAAREVCAALDEPGDTDAIVTTLVHKSVLKHSEAEGRSRYQMPSQLVAFGRRVDPELATRARRAHADYCAALACRAADQWYGPDEIAWMRTLDQVMPSMNAAVSFLLDSGEQQRALELAVNLCRTRYHIFAGALNGARRLLTRCLEACRDRPSVLVVQGLALAAWIALVQGKPQVATELIEQCHAIMRRLGEVAVPGELRFADATRTFLLEEQEATGRLSVALMQQLIHQETRPGDKAMRWLFGSMAAAFYADAATARQIVDAHLADAERCGAEWAISWALWVSALKLVVRDEYDAALQLLQRALRMQYDQGDTWGPSWTLWLIAVVAALSGRHEVAVQLFVTAWQRQKLVDVTVEALVQFRKLQQRALAACRAGLGDHAVDREIGGQASQVPDENFERAVRTAWALSPATGPAEYDDPVAGTLRQYPAGLTEREFATFRLLVSDPEASNRDIAEALSVQVRTAENYVRSIRRKLEVSSPTRIALVTEIGRVWEGWRADASGSDTPPTRGSDRPQPDR